MYYYRGTRKGTGREVWEQRAYKDYKTGAWMEVKEPRIINGKQVVYRVGRDKFGQEYKELGGTIIQHGPEGKPEFIPASFYRRNYVQKVAEGGIDLKYDRDTTRATMFKLTAGRQEFESIELDESIASLAGRTLVRKEPQVIKMEPFMTAGALPSRGLYVCA